MKSQTIGKGETERTKFASESKGRRQAYTLTCVVDSTYSYCILVTLRTYRVHRLTKVSIQIKRGQGCG